MDKRTLDNIKTLHRNAQDWARAHIEAINNSGILPDGFEVRIISAYRSYEEQNALFAQGRTKPGPRVTNARGGQSNHNFGVAWDIGIFADGKYLPNSPLYKSIAPIGKKLGLEWGGDWTSFPDLPHYQVPTGLGVHAMHKLKLAGNPIPVPEFHARERVFDVAVFHGSKKTDIKAFLKAGVTWVEIVPFLDEFGGDAKWASSSELTVALNGKSLKVAKVVEGKQEFCPFREVNQVLHLHFQFEKPVLRIIPSEVDN